MKVVTCLLLVFFSYLSFGSFAQEAETPSIEINDKALLDVLDKYIKYLRQEDFENRLKRQIILRVDTISYNQVVYYVWGTSFLGVFRDDLPHTYFEYRGKTVFIYKNRKVISFETKKFSQFHRQFNRILEKDIDTEGNEITSDYIYCDIYQPWRIYKNKNGTVSIKTIDAYPTSDFFEKYDYDAQGFQIYKDGIYNHIAAVPNFAQPPKNFSVRQFITEKTGIPKDSLRRYDRITQCLVVIDENGKAIEAKIIGIADGEVVDPETRKKIEGALLSMPPWKPAILKGKKVKVRTQVNLGF